MNSDARSVSRVALRAGLILAINGAIAAAYCYAVQFNRHPERWHTDGTLYLIGDHEHHETLILGSSRTFHFGRCRGVHERLEAALNRPIHNLSTPAAGILLTKLHMEEYWAHGNTCDHIVYFADTPYFYSRFGNERLPILEFQPFSASFLCRLIRNNVELPTIVFYLRSKFTLNFLIFDPLKYDCSATLPEARARNLERATQRRNTRIVHDNFYDQGISQSRLNHYMAILEEFIILAEQHDTRLTLISPPILLTSEPGDQSFKHAIRSLADKHSVPYHDYTKAMSDPRHFLDLDHLNERGAAHFAREYLRPILDAQPQ